MSRRSFYPEPLYRALPFLYIVAGVLASIYLDSVTATISGMLLVTAGLLVLGWRFSARGRRREQARRYRGQYASGTKADPQRAADSNDMRWE